MRLIDADALLEKIENYYQYNASLNREIAMWVNDEPTVKPKPEIIRCKNCKHRHTEDCPMYHVEFVEYDDDGYIEMDDIEYDNTEDDGFCNNAERRTDD